MNKKLYSLFGILIILSLVLSACGRSSSGSSGNTGNAQPGSANTGGDSLPVAEDVADKWPEDVPLPEGAYDIDVARGASQLNFKLPGNIEDTVAYLQEELPAYGWETEVAPDSAVGAMATMLRANAEGHRMSINIQYNQLGDFVTITMAIVREGN
jgi:hypothetical protein